MSDQQKTPFGIWITAGLILLLCYPLSLGPVAYVITRIGEHNLHPWIQFGLLVIYYPVLWPINAGPEWISRPGRAYIEWWTQ